MVVAALGSTACTPAATEPESGISVVASFYPLEEAATIVGGDRVHVRNLTPPGVEAHDIELTSGALEAIGAADLVIYMGDGFQPSIEDALADVPQERKIDVLAGADLLSGDGSVDPHLWLDPVRYASVVGSVRDALARVDPDGEAVYSAAAQAFSEELRALDLQIREGLQDCDSRLLVTGHEAFAYLAEAYDLEEVGISGLSPEAEPGPDRLAYIRDLVRERGVTTVFAEAQLPRDVVDLIGAETGAKVAVLDPLETLTEEQRAAGEGYVSVMRRNLEALEEGLGCD